MQNFALPCITPLIELARSEFTEAEWFGTSDTLCCGTPVQEHFHRHGCRAVSLRSLTRVVELDSVHKLNQGPSGAALLPMALGYKMICGYARWLPLGNQEAYTPLNLIAMLTEP